MAILNYMVNREARVNPALLEGMTQDNIHDRVCEFCCSLGGGGGRTRSHGRYLEDFLQAHASVATHTVTRFA